LTVWSANPVSRSLDRAAWTRDGPGRTTESSRQWRGPGPRWLGQTKFDRRSSQALSTDLGQHGHAACPTTVARLPRAQDDSPRTNVQRFTGPDHSDRDLQFQNIQEWIDVFEDRGLPILSVDGKKEELIGNFKNPGAVWRDAPEEVHVYDFLSDAECRAVPSGIDDLLSGRGHLCVGTSAGTAAFAVGAIGAWWARSGCKRYRGRTSC
jgi:hypothetical protein